MCSFQIKGDLGVELNVQPRMVTVFQKQSQVFTDKQLRI